MPGKETLKVRKFPVVLLHVLSIGACAEKKSDLREDVTKILDGWTTRVDARAALDKLGRDRVTPLSTIAADESEIHQRRWHAILLLGNLANGESVTALANIATSASPVYRCFALQALTETRSERAIQVAVAQLDNNSLCMTSQSTDPAREEAISVSDVAVRALETITGKSFEPIQESPAHRAVEPWKKWWHEQAHGASDQK